MTAGEKIKELRLKKGLTQQELAEMVGYKTASAINKIELGYRQIKFAQVITFANVLGCKAQDIVSDIVVPTAKTNLYDLLDDEDKAIVNNYIEYLLAQEKYGEEK